MSFISLYGLCDCLKIQYKISFDAKVILLRDQDSYVLLFILRFHYFYIPMKVTPLLKACS